MRPYEIHALRYAMRDAQRSQHFVGGDPHDGPMAMDYFVWIVRNADRTIVVDTGFTAETAARRKRTWLRCPADSLSLLGVAAATVPDVVLTHMHYDHVGSHCKFPGARFHLQDDEMAYATGRYMQVPQFGHSYEEEDIVGMVRLVFRDRVAFHRGDEEIAPGVTVHRIGGHTAGIQCVRVFTQRGWVVLASDTSHYYEHFETNRIYPITFHLGEVVDGYARLRRLADSPQHIIPGHDPRVMQRYPASDPSLAGIAVRLDLPPIG
jgi:glyoxylase-like metal-dependent hydrolase (beta-lactamase superfamily II)